MSKAFTRESDDSEESSAPTRAPLPPGTQNYITTSGATRIQSELNRLLEAKRAEPNLPSTETRIQYLQNLIKTFVIVEPTPSDVVRFGSTVSVIQNGARETYRIVGVDEIDLDQNHISWLSPLARALMSHRVDDHLSFQAPAGRQELTILSIR